MVDRRTAIGGPISPPLPSAPWQFAQRASKVLRPGRASWARSSRPETSRQKHPNHTDPTSHAREYATLEPSTARVHPTFSTRRPNRRPVADATSGPSRAFTATNCQMTCWTGRWIPSSPRLPLRPSSESPRRANEFMACSKKLCWQRDGAGSFGSNHPRLVALKNKYDPTNFLSAKFER